MLLESQSVCRLKEKEERPIEKQGRMAKLIFRKGKMMKSVNKTKTLALALLLFAVLALTPAVRAAEIWTDQEDYAPWEIVTISGSGFQPSTEDAAVDITVTITWPDGYVDGPYSGTTNDLGNFIFIYGKDKFNGTYTVVVEDSTGIRATTTFTDSELASVEVVAGTQNAVIEVQQGQTVNFTINLSSAGNLNPSYSSSNPTTATIPTLYSIGLGGAVSTGTPSTAYSFWWTPTYNSQGNPTPGPVTWTEAPTPYSVSAQASAALDAPLGYYTISIVATIVNPAGGGNPRLTNDVVDSLTIHVVEATPPPPSDTTPPVIIPTVTGTLGNNGWYVSDVTVSWSVSDPESGIASSSGAGTTVLTSDTAGTTLTCSATNGAGLSNSVSVMIKIDKTGPVVTASASPTPNANGWNNTDVIVTFSATDASGMDTITPPVTVTTEGDGQLITGYATDLAGNVGSASITLNIDKTPPVITAGTPTGTAGNGGWWISDVTVPFSAMDNLSGFAPDGALSIDMAPKTTSGEGSALYVTSEDISDLAGNPAIVVQAGPFKVDKTAPEITIDAPIEGALYLLNEEVFADWSATDAVSGVASDSATLNGVAIAEGGLLTGSVGAKTFIVTATNGAGLTATEPVTYKVQYDFGGFLPPVTLQGRSAFKLGSTVPVKFQLFDADGIPVSNAVAMIRVFQTSDGVTPGTEGEVVSTAAATTGNLFRYDPTGQLYIFNLATKKLSQGQWLITVHLDDGSEDQSVLIEIKK
jgi:hypothetical protein